LLQTFKLCFFFSLQQGNLFLDCLLLVVYDGQTATNVASSFRLKSKLKVPAGLHSPLAIRYFQTKREIVSKLLLYISSWRSTSYQRSTPEYGKALRIFW